LKKKRALNIKKSKYLETYLLWRFSLPTPYLDILRIVAFSVKHMMASSRAMKGLFFGLKTPGIYEIVQSD